MSEVIQARPEDLDWDRYEEELNENNVIDHVYLDFQAEAAVRAQEARAYVQEALQPRTQEVRATAEAKAQWLGQAATMIAYMRDDVRGVYQGQ